MSGRRGQTLAPSLFPFLAVLVCTLGTLILLLALVSQNAVETAQHNQQAQQQQRSGNEQNFLTADDAQKLIDQEELRANHLISIRDEQTADIGDRRDQLGHLEDHLSRLREKLDQLRLEVEAATAEKPSGDVDSQTLVMLRDELEAQQKAIQEIRDAAQTQQPRVVIVPHKGPNGTDRRPVYLECTKDGVTIWPENVSISMVQLADATRDANPLDAALCAIRLHALQIYGDVIAPYPLLVVRPAGITSYVKARTAMQDWDDQFGYELVPADIELAFHAPDKNLERRINIAVRQATNLQRARSSMIASYRQLGGPGGNGDDPFGGGQAGAGEFGGEASEDGYGDDSGRSRAGSSTGRLPTLSAADLARQARAKGYQQDFDRSMYRPGNRAPMSQTTGRAPIDQMLDQMQSDADRLRADGRLGGNNDGDAGASADQIAAAMDVLNADPSSRSSDPPSLQLDGQSQPSSQTATSSTATSSSVRNQAATSSSGQTQMSAAAGASNNPMAAQAMTAPSPQQQAQQPPQASQTMQREMQADAAENLVRREGRDWALPASIAGMRGTAVVRPIRVQCYHDRFVLLPASVNGATEVFTFMNGDIQHATMRLATAVRDRVDMWGASLPGGRWQPQLRVEVDSKGVQRFHQLRTLLRDSGLEVQGVPNQ